MLMTLSTVLNNKNNCKNGGAYWNRGAYNFTKTHSKGGAYSEGGAYWKEGAKSNLYGSVDLSDFNEIWPK